MVLPLESAMSSEKNAVALSPGGLKMTDMQILLAILPVFFMADLQILLAFCLFF